MSKTKLTLLICMVFIDIVTMAQDTVFNKNNTLTISPLLKLKYERYIKRKPPAVSFGVIFQSYFINFLYRDSTFYGWSFSGFQAKAFIRLYMSRSIKILRSNKHKGPYMQGNINGGYYYGGSLSYGRHNTGGGYGIPGVEKPDTSAKRNFNAYGGGISLGYQWIKGKKKNIVIDWEIVGYNYMPLPKNVQTLIFNNGEEKKLFSKMDKNWTRTYAPGSVISGMIAIGYKF